MFFMPRLHAAVAMFTVDDVFSAMLSDLRLRHRYAVASALMCR